MPMENADVMKNSEAVLRIEDITKSFPGVVANKDISFDVLRGEIHALVGENGAGKSTLMKIVTGLYSPDRGRVIHEGRPVQFIEAGIGIVHQHFMLVPNFTVTENVILGAEPPRRGLVNLEDAAVEVEALCRRFGLKVNPRARIEDISVGEQQRVEILKVLYRGADLIILDEPTAVLVPHEAEELFEHLQHLKNEGKTVVFISHKLDEVLRISDRITTLRRGEVVGTVKAADVDRSRLAEMMVGRPVLFDLKRSDRPAGEVILSVDHVTAHATAPGAGGVLEVLKDLSLGVRAGEVYGVAGVEGNGQTELAEVIMGLRPVARGKVSLRGEDVTRLSTAEVRRRGVAFIPEDRHRRGLTLPMTVWENMILGFHRTVEFARRGRLLLQNIYHAVIHAVKGFDVRLSTILAPAYTLSGGNQQKLILAREFRPEPEAIVAAQPTRGLDIGATEFVRQQLLDARDRGAAVLLISADLDEVLSVSDRIGVIYEGHIQAEFAAGEVDPKTLGYYMTGGRDAPGGEPLTAAEGGSQAS